MVIKGFIYLLIPLLVWGDITSESHWKKLLVQWGDTNVIWRISETSWTFMFGEELTEQSDDTYKKGKVGAGGQELDLSV